MRSAPVKFLFEDDFAAAHGGAGAKRSITAAAHEAALARAEEEAYRNAFAAADAKIEGRAAAACERIAEGIEDCLALLATNFNFRGFSLVKEVPESDFEVWRVTLRNLLMASLIAMTDAAPGPSEVRVKVEIQGGFAEISIRLSPRQDEFEALPFGPSYRHLDWNDVQALATAESVELVRGPDQIVMRMPRAVVTAPLRIAPV